MITIASQIDYWRTNSDKDIDTATVRIDAKKYTGMFSAIYGINQNQRTSSMVQQDAIKIVRQYIENLNKAGFPISKAYLVWR